MKFRLIAFFSIFFYCCGTSNSSTAQSTNSFIPTIFPNSPNATAFAKYGNYPVNFFSGLPDISIPLYTIESGGLKMPITLSYHASGIKVSDVASWAGLGWSINTAGMVTRSINGKADELDYLAGGLPDHTLVPSTNSDLDIMYDIAGLGRDSRPDFFSYNIPGHSGNFFFNGNNNYQIQKMPFSPVAILWNKDISHNNALSFTIKDESGDSYFLGQNYYETTNAAGGLLLRSYTATSAWMLEKVISSNKRDTINISYNQGSLSHPDAFCETVLNSGCLAIRGSCHSAVDVGGIHNRCIRSGRCSTSRRRHGREC